MEKCLRLVLLNRGVAMAHEGAGREPVPSAGEVTLHIRGVVSFREEQGAPAGGHKGPSHLRVPDFHGPSP